MVKGTSTVLQIFLVNLFLHVGSKFCTFCSPISGCVLSACLSCSNNGFANDPRPSTSDCQGWFVDVSAVMV